MTSKIQKTEKVNFRPRKRRKSKYQDIFDKVLKLKVGQSFLVPTPKDCKDVLKFRNRLSVAMHRGVKDQVETEDQELGLACTEDNKVAISLYALE